MMHSGGGPTITEPTFPLNWYRYWPRSHEWVLPSGIITGGGSLRTDLDPAFDLTAGVGVGIGMAETYENLGGNAGGAIGNRPDMLRFVGGAAGLWGRPMIAHVRMDERARDPGNANVQMGFGIGSYNAAPAFLPAAPFAVTPQFNIIHVYCDNAGPPSGWFLHVNRGNGGAGVQTTVAFTGAVTAPGTINRPKRLSIYYKPDEYIKAFVDGILGVELTTVGQLPDPIRPGGIGMACYVMQQGAAAAVTARYLSPTILTAGIE